MYMSEKSYRLGYFQLVNNFCSTLTNFTVAVATGGFPYGGGKV